MSRWTHINGSIRVDSLRLLGDCQEPRFDKLFKTVTYEDIGDQECNVPCGSEGSIDVKVYTNKNESCIAAYVVSFFGDLRDFGGQEDIESVKKWFNNICSKLWVRQAVLQILDEGDDALSCVVEYKNESVDEK